jgi:hypothetical protein
VALVADFEKIKEKVGEVVGKAGKSLSELDMGVAYTKMEDAISALDLEGKKQQIRDFIDSPKMDEIKSAGRTVRDFLGYVPNYAQSIPGMVKDGLEKLRKK